MPDSEEQKPDVPESGDRMPDAAASIPAIFTDAFSLDAWPGFMRITFGEALIGKVHYRVAVMLPIEDAKALSDDIAKLIERRKDNAAAKV